MILGIDASNISSGGGKRHLVGWLMLSNQPNMQFANVVLWAPLKTLSEVNDKVGWLSELSLFGPAGLLHLFMSKKRALEADVT